MRGTTSTLRLLAGFVEKPKSSRGEVTQDRWLVVLALFRLLRDVGAALYAAGYVGRPQELWRLPKLGRKGFLQRMVTTLIVGGSSTHGDPNCVRTQSGLLLGHAFLALGQVQILVGYFVPEPL